MTPFALEDLPGPAGALAWLGAGDGAEIAAPLAAALATAGFGAAMLVEPDPLAHEALLARFGGRPGVRLVRAVAVAGPLDGGAGGGGAGGGSGGPPERSPERSPGSPLEGPPGNRVGSPSGGASGSGPTGSGPTGSGPTGSGPTGSGSGGGAEGRLRRYSVAGLAALRAPTGLMAIFPGLESLGEEPVALVAAPDLVADLLADPAADAGPETGPETGPNTGPGAGLDTGADAGAGPRAHVLVLDMPGENLAILDALAAAGLLRRFARVAVREGIAELYEGAGDLAAIAARLSAAGFRAAVRRADEPDRPWLRMDRDLAATKHAPDPSLPERIDQIVATAETGGADFYAAVEREAAGRDAAGRVQVYLALADRFRAGKNRMMALDSLTEAEEALPRGAPILARQIVERYTALGEPRLALACLIETALADCRLADREAAALRAAFESGPTTKGEHGHMLLLSHFAAHPPKPADGRRRVLIEVGTTRERVPGQGSTLKLARFCADHGLHMITVDMDPRNGALAARGFLRMGAAFQAVTARGEDYLAEWEGPVDYAFLDAYDFDHGQHSELRQSRYQAFLGSRIDEEECHRMHLRCAEVLAAKLAPDGLICIDDTWRAEDGGWTAKGTLAVPYLLEVGFEILKAENRAVLMRRAAPRPPASAGLKPETDAEVPFPAFKLRIDTTDRSAAAYRTRPWFEEVTSPFYDHLREDLSPGLLVDVGANFGAVSLTLRTRMPDVPLISVEPNPTLHPYLEENLAPYAKGWRLEKAILAREAGAEITFHLNPSGSQDSRVIAPRESWPSVAVRATTLSAVLADVPTDTRLYLKIDTQGYEASVIGGGLDWLGAASGWLIRAEFAPDWMRSQGSDPGAYLAWLAETFVVAEFPARYGFHDRPGRLLAERALAPADAPDFLDYCTGLDRDGRGWVDILICPKDSPLLSPRSDGGAFPTHEDTA